MTIGHTLIGEGQEKIMVLHGWFGDYTVFNPMLPYLDGDRFTYAFIDYRGYGKSTGIEGDYTVEEISHDTIELADELGWDQFHVIGHSMGGSAAQRVVVDAGGRVKSAVCVTPVPASGMPLDEQGYALFHGAAKSDENRTAIIDFSTGSRLSATWVSHLVSESRRTTTQEAYAAYLTSWSETDFSDEAQGNPTPFLVAIGQFDPAINKDAMEATYMKFYPNAKLEIIPNSGHYPMQETPVYLATLWESFFSEHA